MPVYEYRCEKCALTFEAMQKFSDPPLSACRFCGGPVKKLISQTAFSLKGDGWYQHGYAPKVDKPAACPSAGSGGGGGCAGCPNAAANE